MTFGPARRVSDLPETRSDRYAPCSGARGGLGHGTSTTGRSRRDLAGACGRARGHGRGRRLVEHARRQPDPGVDPARPAVAAAPVAPARHGLPLLPDPEPRPHHAGTSAPHGLPDAGLVAGRADRGAVHRARRPDDGDGQVAARALRRERDQYFARRRRRARAGEGRGRQDPQPLPRLPDVPQGHGRQPAQGCAVRGPARHRKDLHGQGDGARGRRSVPVRLVDRVPVAVLRRDRPQDPQLLQGAAQGCGRGGRRDRLHRGDRRHRRRAQRHARDPVRRTSRFGRLRVRPAWPLDRAQHERRHLGRRQRAAHPDAVVRHTVGRATSSRAGGSTG